MRTKREEVGRKPGLPTVSVTTWTSLTDPSLFRDPPATIPPPLPTDPALDSDRRHAAVDAEGLADDVARFLSRQIDDRGGDLLRAGQAGGRRGHLHRRFQRLGQRREHR